MNITIVGTLLGLLMAAIPLYVFYVVGAKSLRTLLLSVVRMLTQMAFASFYLYWLYGHANGWLAALWLLLMVLLTVVLVLPRSRLRPKLMFLPVTGSLLMSTLIVGFYLLTAVLRVDDALSVRWLVPVMGTLLAIEGETCPLLLREYFVGLKRFSSTYYYHLGNGKPWWQAVMPMLRRSFERGFVRLTRQMAPAGLLLLPLLLTGQLLGGVDVLSAAAATVMLILGGLCASVQTLLFVVVVSHRFFIDKRGKLTIDR